MRSSTNQNCTNLQCTYLQNKSCEFLQMNSKNDWLTDLPTTFNPLRIRVNGSPYFLHDRELLSPGRLLPQSPFVAQLNVELLFCDVKANFESYRPIFYNISHSHYLFALYYS